MIGNLEFIDWLFVVGPILLAVLILFALKVAYAMKSYAPMPPTKPKFCLLPKYFVSLPLTAESSESELATQLARFGFRERRRDGKSVVFSRGSELGDFSIKIAKVVATANLPLEDPVELNIEYGVAFGCAFDTGDLWKFCRELAEKIESSKEAANLQSG